MPSGKESHFRVSPENALFRQMQEQIAFGQRELRKITEERKALLTLLERLVKSQNSLNNKHREIDLFMKAMNNMMNMMMTKFAAMNKRDGELDVMIAYLKNMIETYKKKDPDRHMIGG
jgi:septal ring factor EnvC (AmiA/AmiB activator)